MHKPPIDNNYTPPPKVKCHTVDYQLGKAFIDKVERSGYTVLKTIETETSVYVEFVRYVSH